MKLAIKTDVDSVFRRIDEFMETAQAVAMPRALNRLRDQAQTVGLRKIADIYQIGPRTSEKYLRVKLAAAADLEASIIAKGSGFPLYAFRPRQTKQGVSVLVKGRRFIIPHSFIATMPSGHVGIFARGAYGSKGAGTLRVTGSFGRFKFGRGRRVKKPNIWGVTELPINEFYTFGPAETLSNPDVVGTMEDRVEEQAAKVIHAEIRFAARR